MMETAEDTQMYVYIFVIVFIFNYKKEKRQQLSIHGHSVPVPRTNQWEQGSLVFLKANLGEALRLLCCLVEKSDLLTHTFTLACFCNAADFFFFCHLRKKNK